MCRGRPPTAPHRPRGTSPRLVGFPRWASVPKTLDEPSVHPKWAPVTGKWTKKGTCHTVRKTRLKNMKPIPGKKKCPKKIVVVQVHEQVCTTVLPRACIYALQCVSFELLHVVCCSISKETQGSSQCRQEVSCIETSVARLATSNCLSTRLLIVYVCEN